MINQAFPLVWHNPLTDKDEISLGMTLRDYFAAKALPKIIDCWMQPVQDTFDLPEVAEAIAHEAYQMADAMMRAREE